MSNPYEWTFSNPELFLLYLAASILLAGWLFYSFAYIIRQGGAVKVGITERWDSGLPPKDLPPKVLWVALCTAVNLVLVGAFVYAVT